MIPVLLPLWCFLSILLFLSLFRLLRFPWLHVGEELFFSCVAALAWISLAAMLLGAIGQANVPAFFLAAAATGACGLALGIRSRKKASAPPGIPSPREYALCLAALLVLPFCLLPPFFYDTLHYHFGLPSLFLRSGSTFPIPYFVESHFPLGVEMLFLVGMSDGGYFGANLANFALYILCGLGILCLSDRLGARRAGLFALPLFLFSSTAVHIFFLQKNDIGATLFFFAFAYAFLLYLESGEDRSGLSGVKRSFLVLSGAFAGAALSAKYTMIAFVPAIAAVGFLAKFRRVRANGNSLQASVMGGDVLLFLAGCAAVYAVWPLRNLVVVGNPVYPLMAGLFRSPGWSPARLALLSGDAHPMSAMLHSWRDVAALLSSFSFFPRPGITGVGSALGAGVVGGAVFLFRRTLSPGWFFLRNAVAVFVMIWFLTSWFSRFLLPVLPLMALFSGSLIDGLSRKVGRTGTWFAVGILAIALSAQASSLREPPDAFRVWKASLSLLGHPERANALVSRILPTMHAARFVNTRLPVDARLLFLGDTATYYYRRDFVAPSAFDVHPLQGIATPEKKPKEILRELRALGFTHVLVNWPEWRRLGDTYYRTLWPNDHRIAVERFLAELPVLYRDGVAAIYALEEPGRGARREGRGGAENGDPDRVLSERGGVVLVRVPVLGDVPAVPRHDADARGYPRVIHRVVVEHHRNIVEAVLHRVEIEQHDIVRVPVVVAEVGGLRLGEMAKHRLRLGHPRLVDHHAIGGNRHGRKDADEQEDDGDLDQREPAPSSNTSPLRKWGGETPGQPPEQVHFASLGGGFPPGRGSVVLREARIFSDSSFSSAAVGWK